MDIPVLNLASNPSVPVYLREATVEETFDFSDVDSGKEEALTTKFLEKIQLPEQYTDPRFWTADDRRLMLFWYYIHTHKDTDIEPRYDCDCGSTHKKVIDLKSFSKRYTPIQGKPFRNAKDPDGNDIIVYPFNGAAMEEMELVKSSMDGLEPDSGAYKRKLAELSCLATTLSFKYADEEDKPEDRAKREKKVKTMEFRKFTELQETVINEQAGMNHGLPTEIVNGVIYLISDVIQCPKDKEVTTRLRLRFRNSYYIPRL